MAQTDTARRRRLGTESSDVNNNKNNG